MITKRVISFFTFGVFLIFAGVLSKIFKWPQANLLLAIGLVFELFAVLLFIWKKIKN
jgi:hypothetical protein